MFISNDNTNYEYSHNYIGNGALSWDIIKPKVKGKYILIIFNEDSTLGEIALYNNSKEKIKIDNIDNIEISLSHCKEYATANVVAILKNK